MRDLIRQLREDAEEPSMRGLVRQLRESFDIHRAADEFMKHCVPHKRHDSAMRHLDKLIAGYQAGEIYNVDYKDAKDYLGRCVDEAWDAATGHFWHGKGGQGADSAFSDYVGFVSNLNDTIARKKKLDKLKPTTKISKYGSAHTVKEVSPEYISVARQIINAAHPIAMLVKELKTKIVKGRKPNPEAQARRAAQLAKKDMKTCACCFRSIARLKNGKIADHGYSLPQRWAKTASCPGYQFRPLEVSDDGLKYMVKMISRQISDTQAQLKRAPQLKTLTVRKGWGKQTEPITPDDPKWPAAFKSYVASLESQLKGLQGDLKTYETHLRNWKPTEK